ncbi:unnamed protein product, partial [Coregonus sp. 'balchen']
DISIGIKCSPGVVGPAEADIDFDIIRNDNDTFTVKYTPQGAGSYTIMVLFADQVSRVSVDPSHNASKVKAEGPGLNHSGVELNKLTHFTVNAKAAGKAKLDAVFSGPAKGETVKDFEIINNHDNTHTVKYTPVQQGPLGVAVTYGGDSVPKSPFSIPVVPSLDLSNIQVAGLGDMTVKCKGAGGQGMVWAKVTGPSGTPVTSKVEAGLKPDTSQVKFIPWEAGPYQMGETGEFVVDCTNAGPAELTIEIIGDSGTEAEVHIQDNGDGTYTITYIPLCPGSYTLTIRYGGQDVPNFPARLAVEPAVNTSGVLVFGPGVEGKGVFREATTDFSVDARPLTQTGGNHIKTVIQNPSGAVTDAVITDHYDGTYSVEYTPYQEGPHSVEVTYDETPVPNSPFRVAVMEGCDPGRVRVHGPGLDTGITNKANQFTGEGLGTNVRANIPQAFTVDASKAGVAPLQVRVQGPKGVRASGPGLNTTGVPASLPVEFTIDVQDAGEGRLAVQI